MFVIIKGLSIGNFFIDRELACLWVSNKWLLFNICVYNLFANHYIAPEYTIYYLCIWQIKMDTVQTSDKNSILIEHNIAIAVSKLLQPLNLF